VVVFWRKGDAMERSAKAPRAKRADWVDFEKIKAEVPLPDVLAAIGILDQLERAGDELRDKCPLCGKGKETSFSANVTKRVFQTFCCRKKGNILDFARLYKQADIKTAGQWLEQFLAERPEAEQDMTTEEASALEEPGAGTGRSTSAAEPRSTEEDLINALEAFGRELLEKVIGQSSQKRPETLQPLIASAAHWLARRLKEQWSLRLTPLCLYDTGGFHSIRPGKTGRFQWIVPQEHAHDG
jgi:DNA primase